MMDSTGDNDDKLRWGLKELAEGDLPWKLAEDNPVISPCEEITLNKTRERRPCSAGDKLPESTGDEL